MIEVPLTHGRIALIDDLDLPLIQGFRWNAMWTKWNWYASAAARLPSHPKTTYMHRLIAEAPDGVKVDHIDHDGLNNQRSNLRLATNVQNNANSRRPVNNTSGYKGVSFHKANGCWCAYVTIADRKKYVGRYFTPEDAARAYDARARAMYGEFACCNFPSELLPAY